MALLPLQPLALHLVLQALLHAQRRGLNQPLLVQEAGDLRQVTLMT